MHEMAIALELVDQLEALADEHGFERIEEVSLAAGVLRGIVPEAMETAFAAAAEGTRAQGAVLILRMVAAEAQCRRCGRRFAPEIAFYLCPGCGRADVTLLAGNDIILASVSGRQADGKESP